MRLRFCAGCADHSTAPRYCDESCQRAAWPTHRVVCARVRRAAAPARAAPHRTEGSDLPDRREVIEHVYCKPLPRAAYRPRRPASVAEVMERAQRVPAMMQTVQRVPSLALARARYKPPAPSQIETTRNTVPAPAAAVGHPYATPAFGTSRLSDEERDRVEILVERLKRDRTKGRIAAPEAELREMAIGVAESRRDGTNPRTSSKNELAWREFKAYAKVRGFDPNLCTQWTKSFPERENLKLASWLLHLGQQMKPRSNRDTVAKPMSIYAKYLALRRVFQLRSQELPPSREVRETLRGLIRRYIRRFGIENLRPKRAEPITPRIVRSVLRLARQGTAQLAAGTFSLARWVCFIVVAWMVINLSVGSRKGESTKLPGDTDDNDWFTRSSVTLGLGKRTIVDPTESEWRAMKEGCKVYLAPKGAKCDPYGTCHGTEPIILPFHDDDLNAARWIRDIELRWPCHGTARQQLPLFCDEHGEAFTDSRFGGLIKAALVLVLGVVRAAAFSPHSWRVWLATAARKGGASDAMIQALGRWLNPESVKLYARLTAGEYAKWVDKIMSYDHVDATRTTNLPVMDAADVMQAWPALLKEPATQGKRKRTERDAFDEDVAERHDDVLPPLDKGTRVDIFWTEERQWYTATVTSWCWEDGDDGHKQRATRMVYDAVAGYHAEPHWHCLDDVTWRVHGNE